MKVETGTEFHASAGPWENAHTVRTVSVQSSEQDELAKRLLQKANVSYELVDLSKGFRTELRARLHGVKDTPTLWVETGPVKVYAGVKAIMQYLETQVSG